MADGAISKGFSFPKLLAWIMVFAGIIIFFIGIPIFLSNLFFLSYFRHFDPTGLIMIILGPIIAYIGYRNTGFILRREEIIDRWSVLIENGKGKGDDVFDETKRFIVESKAPKIAIERKEISPTIAKDIFGIKRNFLIVTNLENPKLSDYKVFICARDYGNNLDVSWYLTYKLSFLEAIFNLFLKGYPRLDLFDEQDLRAYVTTAHHSLLKSVENLMLKLNQDPSKIDRKSKGFLGVS